MYNGRTEADLFSVTFCANVLPSLALCVTLYTYSELPRGNHATVNNVPFMSCTQVIGSSSLGQELEMPASQALPSIYGGLVLKDPLIMSQISVLLQYPKSVYTMYIKSAIKPVS